LGNSENRRKYIAEPELITRSNKVKSEGSATTEVDDRCLNAFALIRVHFSKVYRTRVDIAINRR